MNTNLLLRFARVLIVLSFALKPLKWLWDGFVYFCKEEIKEMDKMPFTNYMVYYDPAAPKFKPPETKPPQEPELNKPEPKLYCDPDDPDPKERIFSFSNLLRRKRGKVLA